MRIVPRSKRISNSPAKREGYVQFQTVALSDTLPWGFQPILSALYVLPWISRIHSASMISSDLCCIYRVPTAFLAAAISLNSSQRLSFSGGGGGSECW